MTDRPRTRRTVTEERLPGEEQPAEDEPRRPVRGRRPADEEPGLAGDETAGEPTANGRRRAQRRPRRQGEPALTARQAARAALRQIAELTAKQPEDITGVELTPDGGWTICFEVVEDHRIPSSADILATYEATIDTEGELTGYRRVKRYARGRGDGGGS